jgi:hypothetical protein
VGLFRHLLASLIGIRVVSEDSRRVRNILASPRIAECRKHAVAAGFRRLGVTCEGSFTSEGIISEVWVHPTAPVYLNINKEGYYFSTRLEGLYFLTFGHAPIRTKSSPRVVASPSEGTFAWNLRAHLGRVGAASRAAYPHETLEDRIAMVRAYYREHASMGQLTKTALVWARMGPISRAILLVFLPFITWFGPYVLLGYLALMLMFPFLVKAVAVFSETCWAEDGRWWRTDTLGVPTAPIEPTRVEPRLSSSPRRCPYCHDEVQGETGAVCVDCLARHHEECWTSHGACATCRSTRRFMGVGESRLGPARDRPAPQKDHE